MASKIYKIKKAVAYIKHYGPDKLAKKAIGKLIGKDGYSEHFSELVSDDEELFFERGRNFKRKPLISVLVPVYNPPAAYFKEMLLSVINQTYFNWQLCLVDAGTDKQRAVVDEIADGDERVCYVEIDNAGIAENTNAALAMARGEYIALLDNDDTLSSDALYRMVEMINRENADCLYSDEDKMDSEGKKHFCPHVKPDFNPQLLRSNNYICHLFVVRTELAREVGGFSKAYDGAQDYDFILKCTEKAEKISHVNRVLYHWRTHESSTSANPLSKLYAYEAGKKAIEAHLERMGIAGRVSMLDDMGFYRVEYGDNNDGNYSEGGSSCDDAVDKGNSSSDGAVDRGNGSSRDDVIDKGNGSVDIEDSVSIDSRDGGKNKAASVLVVATGVKDNDTAQKYFKYLRKNTDYENMQMCAMGEPDAARLGQYTSDYFCILMCGIKPEKRDWLEMLVREADVLEADAIAAKLLVKQAFPLCNKISRSFIVYSGDDYKDSFGRVHVNAGKPGWYKGNFNRNILQQNIKTLPKTAILVRHSELMRLLAGGWKAEEGKMYLYEPGVELYK